MFYNKTVFEDNGWEVPTTRAELEEVAAAALEADIHPFTYGLIKSSMQELERHNQMLKRYINDWPE